MKVPPMSRQGSQQSEDDEDGGVALTSNHSVRSNHSVTGNRGSAQLLCMLGSMNTKTDHSIHPVDDEQISDHSTEQQDTELVDSGSDQSDSEVTVTNSPRYNQTFTASTSVHPPRRFKPQTPTNDVHPPSYADSARHVDSSHHTEWDLVLTDNSDSELEFTREPYQDRDKSYDNWVNHLESLEASKEGVPQTWTAIEIHRLLTVPSLYAPICCRSIPQAIRSRISYEVPMEPPNKTSPFGAIGESTPTKPGPSRFRTPQNLVRNQHRSIPVVKPPFTPERSNVRYANAESSPLNPFTENRVNSASFTPGSIDSPIPTLKSSTINRQHENQADTDPFISQPASYHRQQPLESSVRDSISNEQINSPPLVSGLSIARRGSADRSASTTLADFRLSKEKFTDAEIDAIAEDVARKLNQRRMLRALVNKSEHNGMKAQTHQTDEIRGMEQPNFHDQPLDFDYCPVIVEPIPFQNQESFVDGLLAREKMSRMQSALTDYRGSLASQQNNIGAAHSRHGSTASRSSYMQPTLGGRQVFTARQESPWSEYNFGHVRPDLHVTTDHQGQRVVTDKTVSAQLPYLRSQFGLSDSAQYPSLNQLVQLEAAKRASEQHSSSQAGSVYTAPPDFTGYQQHPTQSSFAVVPNSEGTQHQTDSSATQPASELGSSSTQNWSQRSGFQPPQFVAQQQYGSNRSASRQSSPEYSEWTPGALPGSHDEFVRRARLANMTLEGNPPARAGDFQAFIPQRDGPPIPVSREFLLSNLRNVRERHYPLNIAIGSERGAPQDLTPGMGTPPVGPTIQNTEWAKRFRSGSNAIASSVTIPSTLVLPYRPGTDTMCPIEHVKGASVKLQGLTFDGMPKYNVAVQDDFFPFQDTAKAARPAAWGVLKIVNIPYGITKQDVLGFLGRNAKIITPDVGEAVHIIMDRTTGKTMNCYAEFYSVGDAQAAVNKIMRSKDVDGKHLKLNERHVEVEMSSQEALMYELFPKAKNVKWQGQVPVITMPNEPFNTGFKCFITGEELVMMAKYADQPFRFGFSQKVPNRTYESMISLLYKFPWFAVEYYTVLQRDQIYSSCRSMMCSLISQLKQSHSPRFAPGLVTELLYAGLNAPGFSERQRWGLVRAAEWGGHTIAISPLSKLWPYSVLGRKPNWNEDVVKYYVKIVNAGSTTPLGDVATAKDEWDDALIDFNRPHLSMSMAEVAAYEWLNLENAMKQVLVFEQ